VPDGIEERASDTNVQIAKHPCPWYQNEVGVVVSTSGQPFR
jgi:hypothetical protein